LFRRIIDGAAQGDDRVQRIFAAAGAPLAAVDPGMMDYQNSNPAPPKLQQPVLHRKPRVAGTFTTVGQQGRKIVQDQQVYTAQVPFKFFLAFRAA